jgi:NAD(P)-dependent dehydrogenase (short-subunit alcohol dehydrogenase family)
MDRAALVTGASSGIGKAVARRLTEDGYGVVLAARREKELRMLADEIGEEQALPVRTDVTDSSAVANLVESAADRFGRLDVVVTAAGIGSWERLEDMDEETWQHVLDVNLKGTYLVARAALPHLRAARGYLITIASVSGTIGQAGGTAYNTSKWAVRGFTQSFLAENRGEGVRATAINPGLVATPMVGREEDHPEMISVRDVAETVRWLLALSPVVQVKDVVLERTLA